MEKIGDIGYRSSTFLVFSFDLFRGGGNLTGKPCEELAIWQGFPIHSDWDTRSWEKLYGKKMYAL